jgi:hypothetical protein
MTSSQHWELSWIGPDERGRPASEGLGLMASAIRYTSLRGARAARRRLIADDVLPTGGRLVVLKITTEEIPDEETSAPANESFGSITVLGPEEA